MFHHCQDKRVPSLAGKLLYYWALSPVVASFLCILTHSESQDTVMLCTARMASRIFFPLLGMASLHLFASLICIQPSSPSSISSSLKGILGLPIWFTYLQARTEIISSPICLSQCGMRVLKSGTLSSHLILNALLRFSHKELFMWCLLAKASLIY